MTPTPDPWWVAPAIIAALIVGVIALVTLMVNGRRARADRQRELFGTAFGDVSSYCEYPSGAVYLRTVLGSIPSDEHSSPIRRPACQCWSSSTTSVTLIVLLAMFPPRLVDRRKCSTVSVPERGTLSHQGIP